MKRESQPADLAAKAHSVGVEQNTQYFADPDEQVIGVILNKRFDKDPTILVGSSSSWSSRQSTTEVHFVQ